MPQGVEHYKINAISDFNRNAVTTDAIRRFLSFYIVHTLTIFLSRVLIKSIEYFLACTVMDDSSLLKLCSQVRNIEAEMRSIQEKLEEVKYEIDLKLQALLEERKCLLSRVDPFSASRDSLADWIGR
ncbi:MAG: hypothetical protein LH474_02590 [Chamaesiphon sp.]|nr:hypothetical protein [Chamaesiphon sp.]